MSIGGYPDRYVVIAIGAIMIAAALAFWPLLAVILLAASLAVVLLPIQRQFIRVINPAVSAFLIAVLVVLVAISALGFAIAVFYSHADYISYIINTILTWVGTISDVGTAPVAQSEIND